MNWIKSKVIMLPTEGKGFISKCYNENSLIRTKLLVQRLGLNYHNNQHLYFLSDEEIKMGDYFISNQNNHWELQRCQEICEDGHIMSYEEEIAMFQEDCYFTFEKENCFKILSSTDKSLGLPEPSKEFIEAYIKAYNEGSPITKVLVEYDTLTCLTNECNRKITCDECEYSYKILHVRNNTLTIKKLKENWSREEVVELFKKYDSELKRFGFLNFEQFDHLVNWKKQNL